MGQVSVKIKTTLDFYLWKIVYFRLVQAVTALIIHWAKSIPQPCFPNFLDQVCILAACLDFPSMETSIW